MDHTRHSLGIMIGGDQDEVLLLPTPGETKTIDSGKYAGWTVTWRQEDGELTLPGHVPVRGHVRRARTGQVLVRAHRRRTRTAEQRRVALALAFLPPSQRGRYRQEWLAEMSVMAPAEAATFAMQLLLFAPRMGFVLLVSQVFGRRAA
ncbi:hypothetical protein OG444_40500 (plasmid) [Streptomyces sp. NBC_01232]|uniref:hypothetical protein n=1 Tax=Streptomyces sp. NBC_01232 TaxID=2903786 RepID=UPI002E15F6D6|nr:hypothetical protein OG444_40500 [Streptomyces sp. NBC_01232]